MYTCQPLVSLFYRRDVQKSEGYFYETKNLSSKELSTSQPPTSSEKIFHIILPPLFFPRSFTLRIFILFYYLLDLSLPLSFQLKTSLLLRKSEEEKSTFSFNVGKRKRIFIWIWIEEKYLNTHIFTDLNKLLINFNYIEKNRGIHSLIRITNMQLESKFPVIQNPSLNPRL